MYTSLRYLSSTQSQKNNPRIEKKTSSSIDQSICSVLPSVNQDHISTYLNSVTTITTTTNNKQQTYLTSVTTITTTTKTTTANNKQQQQTTKTTIFLSTMSVSNILAGSPPLANYGILTGQLFLYARGRAAFESSKATTTTTPSCKKCILLGGLSDGLLPVPYTALLEEACHEQNWSLVQPVLSSSYLGFGHGSLERDVSELEELMEYLSVHRNGTEFAIVGHSTGCQDAICFLEKSSKPQYRQNVTLVALQAPVSDREGSEMEEGFANKLRDAQDLVTQDRGDEMLPRSHHWAPMTAQRFVDLHAKGGKDDYFSSDYTDAELGGRLQHVSSNSNSENNNNNNNRLKVLVAFSGSDQYVPAHVDKVKLTKRLVDAMNGKFNSNDKGKDDGNRLPVAEAFYIENGDHNLSGPDDAKIFVDKVSELLNRASEG
jgi:pimeloyl-ACP methyl ester carboxylesterase